MEHARNARKEVIRERKSKKTVLGMPLWIQLKNRYFYLNYFKRIAMKKYISHILIIITMLIVLLSSEDVFAITSANEDIEILPKIEIVSLKATANTIVANWKSKDNADSYIVNYRVGTTEQITETNENKITIKELNILNGQKITITVTGQAGEVVVSQSKEVSTYYYSGVNLNKATSPSNKKIRLSWTKNSKITDYEILCVREGERKIIKVHNRYEYTFSAKGDKKYSCCVRGYKRIGSKIYYTSWSNNKSVKVKYDKWAIFLDKYRYNDKVNHIMFVKYTSGSNAEVIFYEKKDNKYSQIFAENAYVGRNGIDKKKEGDGKTPTGTYNLTCPFGIKNNPGARQSYLKVNDNHYWCSDKQYYNQLINIKTKPHYCSGEHLARYGRAYYYCMFIDYNKKGEYPKGSAIFLHCKSGSKTAGCVAISESNMKKVINKAEKGTKICIYKK